MQKIWRKQDSRWENYGEKFAAFFFHDKLHARKERRSFASRVNFSTSHLRYYRLVGIVARFRANVETIVLVRLLRQLFHLLLQIWQPVSHQMDILEYNPVTVACRDVHRLLRDRLLTLSQ